MKRQIETPMGHIEVGRNVNNFNQTVVDDIQLMLNNGADTIYPNKTIIEFFSHRDETDEEQAKRERLWDEFQANQRKQTLKKDIAEYNRLKNKLKL